jgi:hypothetical protein
MPDVLPGMTRQKPTDEIPVEFNRPGHPEHSRMVSPCTCILLATMVGTDPIPGPMGGIGTVHTTWWHHLWNLTAPPSKSILPHSR